jgi:biotin transport system substrate-specific component
MPMSDPGRLADRTLEVGTRLSQGPLDISPQRQLSRDGRGKGAASSMRVHRGQSGTPELEHVIRSADDVDGFVAVEVPALHYYDARAESEDSFRGPLHVLQRPHSHLGEDFGFRNIGRDDHGTSQELGPHHGNGFFDQQSVSTLRDHDGIHDHVGELEAFDRRSNRFDNRRGGEHARLDRVRTYVARHGLYLRDDKIGRHRLPIGDAERVLRGDRGDGCRTVHAVSRECFQVGLDTGTAARIAARNCQCCTHTVESDAMSIRTERLTTGSLLEVLAGNADLSLAIRVCAILFVTVLTAMAAQVSIPLPFTPVPFTFQPMVVLLGGAVLGSRLGMISQVVYLAAGIAGLPVFAASPLLPQGVARLLGPTGGYLMSYPFAAFITGALAMRGFDRRYGTSVLAMAAGLAIVFGGGLAWMAWGPTRLGLDRALQAGLYPFLVADLLKVLLAAAVLPSAWRFLNAEH